MTNQFRHCDSKRPDGVYIQWERQVLHDDCFDPREYLFQEDSYKAQDQARLDAFNAGDWHGIGVRAAAHIYVISNHVSTHYTLESAGLWGVESDSGEAYLDEVFAEEKANLQHDLTKIAAGPFQEI